MHAIREGIAGILSCTIPPKSLHICADNQGALKALQGDKCPVKEALKESLEGNTTSWLAGWNINGQCTPSHEGIPGNDRADRLAILGQKDSPCHQAKTTLL